MLFCLKIFEDMENLLHVTEFWEKFKVSLLVAILEIELVTIAVMTLNLTTVKCWAGRLCLLLLCGAGVYIILCDWYQSAIVESEDSTCRRNVY